MPRTNESSSSSSSQGQGQAIVAPINPLPTALQSIGQDLDYQLALGIEASLQEEIDQERRQANYMGENPLPASNLQNLSHATAGAPAASSSSSSSVVDPPTQYSMKMSLVTDIGTRPAPTQLPPKLADRPDAPDWAKVNQQTIPAKVINPKRPLPVGPLPPPVVPAKKPPPLLPVPKPKPKTGKYGDLAPPLKPFPKPKYY